jgi:DNA-binding FrmR family transcriptional regulator
MRANNKEVAKRLNLAKGQLEGIVRMVQEDRYCLDISNQLLSTIAILKNTNQIILKAHLETCVNESLTPEGKEKIAEIVDIIQKLTK